MPRQFAISATLLAIGVMTAVSDAASISAFGDRNRVAGGAGTTDDYATYSPPAGFNTWLAGTGYPISICDVHNNNLQRTYPFVLNQHAPFAVANQRRATIAFFIFHDPDFPNPATDRIHFWDEQRTDGQSTLRFAFGSRLVALLQGNNDTSEQTVEVEIDLMTGQAHAWRLHPTHGARVVDLGSLGAPWGQDPGDMGSPADVLELARDGSLFGYLEDDMELFSGATLLLEESTGCVGDLNDDGRVDLSDLALLLSAFGTTCR